jgi:hypothetical protein
MLWSRPGAAGFLLARLNRKAAQQLSWQGARGVAAGLENSVLIQTAPYRRCEAAQLFPRGAASALAEQSLARRVINLARDRAPCRRRE